MISHVVLLGGISIRAYIATPGFHVKDDGGFAGETSIDFVASDHADAFGQT